MPDPSSSPARPLVSIVCPVFNEELNVHPFYQAVAAQAERLSSRFRFEFVFTDNHSTDHTFALLRDLAHTDPRVRVFRFSRNFGYQRSIMTGYARSLGDAAIQLDCDLQDPPELLETFLDHWSDGAEVVYGVRIQRQEAWSINVARAVFYRLVDRLSEDRIPVDAGDFRLISRRIINILRSFDDAQPYLRGTIAALGFRQDGIPYARNARTRGESKFPLSKLLSLALDGILNHSVVPLRIATYFGLSVSFLTLLLMLGYTVAKLAFRVNWPAGFTTLAALILISISINAMLLGVIGEYLGRLYTQSRRRPLSLLEQSIDATPGQTEKGEATADLAAPHPFSSV